MNEMEIWKDIPGYEGQYQASNLGRVRSVNRSVLRHSKNGLEYIAELKSQIIKQYIGTAGYSYVRLCSNSKHKHFDIHRLVALSFLPNPANKPQVNHINGNKADNRAENLEWVSRSENIKHAVATGLKSPPTRRKSISAIKDGQIVGTFPSIIAMLRELGLHHTGVWQVLTDKASDYRGYTFQLNK